MTPTAQQRVTRDDALAFADEAFRNRDITFSHRDVVDITGALGAFLQRHRLLAAAIAGAEQPAVSPWFAWPARKTWEEVRVRLRSRDGNEWTELASDFEYWMQRADGEMCDDVVAFQIIGETPLGLASVSSASADALALVPREPTEAMLVGARDWSDRKYGKPIGDDAAQGCWSAMIAASPQPVPAGMKTWLGGDTAPDDWDGGPVLRRHGGLSMPNGAFAWSSNAGGLGNIIAYTPARVLNLPEPVPATNQAGEVERLRAALEQIDRINGGADWNGTRTIARAALATQPATSQEGEGTLANPSTFGKPTFGLAATPTPPTLSEDLRVLVEALRPLADLYLTGSEPDDECAIDASDFPNAGHVRAARDAIAQVKAS